MQLIWEQSTPAIHIPTPLNLATETAYPGVTFRPTDSQGEPLRLHVVEEAEVIWWNYGTVVLDREGRELAELGLTIHERPDIETIRQQEPLRLEGTTASVMSWLPGNYCHIVWESLPLVQALHEAGVLGSVDQVLTDVWADHLLQDVLSIYGSDAKLACASGTGRALVKRLLVFQCIRHPAQWGHHLFGRFFDHLRSQVDDVPRDRDIIVDRPQSRGFTNTDALKSALPGFEVVSLDGRPSLLDQVRLFASARIAVVGHGAALSNLVFMRPNSGIIELFPQQYGSPCFWAIAGMRKLPYCAGVDARGVAEWDSNLKYQPLQVDVPATLAAVELLRGTMLRG